MAFEMWKHGFSGEARRWACNEPCDDRYLLIDAGKTDSAITCLADLGYVGRIHITIAIYSALRSFIVMVIGMRARVSVF